MASNIRDEFPSTEQELRSDSVYGPILFPPDGTGPIDLEQLAKEMGDLMMSEKICRHAVYTATGGRLSKSTYTPESIDAAHNDWLEDHDQQVIDDYKSDHDCKCDTTP